MFLKLLLAACTLLVSTVPTMAEGWTFGKAAADEANELGNCSLFSNQATFFFMASDGPKNEAILIFVRKPGVAEGNLEGPLEWTIGSRTYLAKAGDFGGIFTDYYSEIKDSLFIYDLMRADKATVRNRKGETATLDLFALVLPDANLSNVLMMQGGRSNHTGLRQKQRMSLRSRVNGRMGSTRQNITTIQQSRSRSLSKGSRLEQLNFRNAEVTRYCGLMRVNSAAQMGLTFAGWHLEWLMERLSMSNSKP